MDALGDVLGNVGARRLPGELTPVLAKAVIPFTILFSIILLRRVFAWGEYAGATIVVAGAVIALGAGFNTSDDDDADAGEVVAMGSVIIYVLSSAPNALSYCIKETVFVEMPSMSIFVVSFFASAWQLAFAFVSLPLNDIPGIGDVPLRDLGDQLSAGWRCFCGGNTTDIWIDDPVEYASTYEGEDCSGSPAAPLIYMAVNLAWNISLIVLLKRGGAVIMFLANTVSFPISGFAFLINWPLLGASSFSKFYVLGLAVEIAGLTLYQRSGFRRRKMAADDGGDSAAALLATTAHEQQPTLELEEDHL